jgi:hypothetical protein
MSRSKAVKGKAGRKGAKDEGLQTAPERTTQLSEEQLDSVSGGTRVKSSDKVAKSKAGISQELEQAPKSDLARKGHLPSDRTVDAQIRQSSERTSRCSAGLRPANPAEHRCAQIEPSEIYRLSVRSM